MTQKDSAARRLPSHLFGTRQGLFYLLREAPAAPPPAPLPHVQAALAHAAMGDMFHFRPRP